MNCKTTVEMLSAYLDRELGPNERDAVRSHLADCDRCRAEERDLRSLKGLLLGVRSPEPAEDFERRLMSRLRAEAAEPVGRRLELPRLRPLVLGQFGGLAVAASLAALVVFRSPEAPAASRIERVPASASQTTVARNANLDVYAQHGEAYEQAGDYTVGAPILMPDSDGP